ASWRAAHIGRTGYAAGARAVPVPGKAESAHRAGRPPRAANCDAGTMNHGTAGSLRAVTLDDVRGARKMLSGVSRTTALESSRYLSQAVGAPVHLKCENLQRPGSFKLPGDPHVGAAQFERTGPLEVQTARRLRADRR